MSHPFKSWYDFGDVAVQEREQEVSDSDIDLGDYLVEGWDKDWENEFWEKDDDEQIAEHSVVETGKNIEEGVEEYPEAAIEEQGVPMKLGNDELSEEDNDLPARPAKKRMRTSIDITVDADESSSDGVSLKARKRRHVTQSIKTPAAPTRKQKISRADSKLDMASEDFESAIPSVASDSDTDSVSPPLKSRAKASFKSSSKPRKMLAAAGNNPQQAHSDTSQSGINTPLSLEARRDVFNVKVLSQEQKNAILRKPKESRGDFNWNYPHYLALTIIEHHFGFEKGDQQGMRDGERIFSFVFPDDLALCKKKAGAKDWVRAIYNTYGAKDRRAKRHRWDLVQAAIEAPEDGKSDEYREIRQKVFDAARQLGIVSRLAPGQTKVVDFTKNW